MEIKQIVKKFDEGFAEKIMKKNVKKWREKEDHEQMTLQTQNLWLDIRLKKKTMDYLWDTINNPSVQPTDAKTKLAGNISKSYWIDELKNDWFYDNVLDSCVKTLYFRNFINYYNVYIAKTALPPVFKLKELWVNFQKQHEFNPVHNHAGDFSFVIFMKIPTHWKEQHVLPFSLKASLPVASDFQFVWSRKEDEVCITRNIPLSSEDEGRMLFFPSWLQHQVYPFYGTEEERVTISGNIFLDVPQLSEKIIEQSVDEYEQKEKNLKMVENAARVMKEELEQMKKAREKEE